MIINTVVAIVVALVTQTMQPDSVWPAPRGGAHALAYDSDRRLIMLYGDRGRDASTLWAWDGAKWRAFNSSGPGLRRHIKMAYDASRKRLVLYGGFDDSGQQIMSDTWEWDGEHWQQFVVQGPGPRAAYALQYDPKRKAIVLFGGFAKDGPQRDTWSWNGTQWTQIADGVNDDGPSARGEATLIVDQQSGGLLLSGGVIFESVPATATRTASMIRRYRTDTWSWNGRAWRKVNDDGPARAYSAGVIDPVSRAPLRIAGESDSTYHGDMWRWSGVNWQLVDGATIPARHGAAAAVDTHRKRVVMFGGSLVGGKPTDDLWEWDGVRWTSVGAQTPNGPDFSLAGAAFDDNRARLVVVGSKLPTAASAETWEWNGRAWLLASASGPSARVEPMLTYDSKRNRVLLFGGDRGQQAPLTDTWAWDGTAWKQLAMDGPSPRASSMVYDSKRDRVVLFGGGSNTGALFNDTWEFDGAKWSRVVNDSSPGNPPARALHGAAYDQRRGRTVITGGFGGFNTATRTPTTLNDTWEWDGRAWHHVDISGPGARDHIAMTFVPDRGGVVLHGGGNPSTGLQGDSWLYNGSTWTRILENGPPRGRHRLAYDSRARALFLYGGWAPENRQMTELWSLRADNVWARISAPNP